jgi:transposase
MSRYRLARARRGSNRRGRVRLALARLRAREADRRNDWAEKASTGIARGFDLVRVEDLKIANMSRSARGGGGCQSPHVWSVSVLGVDIAAGTVAARRKP